MYDQLYRESQRRIRDLVSPLRPDELAVAVPACPLWSVADVLAHLAAMATAVADGSPIGPPSEDWTHEQVSSRRGRPAGELFDEWQQATPAVTEVPLTSRSWLPILHDTLSHEADIRGAIGAPQLPGDALSASYQLLAGPIAHRLARLGTVRLDLDQQPIELGTGEPDLVVEASRYEFWRAWFGRRSPAQMQGWVRHGDAVAFAARLPVFPARETDLTEAG